MHNSLHTDSEPTPTIVPVTAAMIDYLLYEFFNKTSPFSSGLLFITFFNTKTKHQIFIKQAPTQILYYVK
jgi:hypothetical protein